MSVSGSTVLAWRERGLCVRCGRHPAPSSPFLCGECTRAIEAEKKRQRKKT